MVTRKTSLPYSVNSTLQPSFPHQNPDSDASLIPDSADLPPIPTTVQRTLRGSENRFQDADNPWSDVSTRELTSIRPLPDILKPGRGRQPEESAPSLSNIPQVLRAGQSQEDTPRSSLDSDRSKDFWDDSDEDGEEGGKKSPERSTARLPELDAGHDPWVNEEPLESSPGIKRKPVGQGASPQASRQDLNSGSAFASNNPFRRSSQQSTGDVEPNAPNWGQDVALSAKGKEIDRGDAQPPTDHFRGLALSSAMPDLSSYNTAEDSESPEQRWKHENRNRPPPMPQAPPPPPPAAGPPSPFSRQPPLIPVSPQPDSTDNPWASNPHLAAPTPSPIPFSASQKQVSSYNDALLDRGQHTGALSLRDELETLPNAAREGAVSREETSLLEDGQDMGPPLPVRQMPHTDTEYYEPPQGPPPTKAPRPVIRTTAPSEEEVARMIEKRNETYQIKHFNWFDHNSRKLRRSAMLTQNKNGPCPLLALVNALILGARNESQAVLDEALRSREQVTLGLIIETLLDELLSNGYEAVGDLPDVDELNSFLMRLRTGMNANPRFVPPSTPPPNLMDADDSMFEAPQGRSARQEPGLFEMTADMKLYGAFSVSLVHGWLPEGGSAAAKAFARSAPTYEDAQALQFGEEELEYKLTNQGLTTAEQNMWEDINAIKNFLQSYPTQLTPAGLEAVQGSVASGSFAIMFRNDHFSTIYKHPENGQLFTLITDAGYADRDEVIWESLVDITGKHNEFFSGDFMPVSHHDVGDESSTHPASRRTSQLLTANQAVAATPLSPQEQQEQHDADFAMALQLQEEEEQRERSERNRRRSSATPVNSHQRRSTGTIPIVLRPPAEARPSIPPRTSHPAIPAVNRPADSSAEEPPPPAYEEAAKGRPYIPPLGSPLHPSAEPSPLNSSTQLTGTTSNASASGTDAHPPGPNSAVGRRQPGRRQSAYTETSQYYTPPRGPGGYPVSPGVGGPSRPGNMQRQERDCNVM